MNKLKQYFLSILKIKSQMKSHHSRVLIFLSDEIYNQIEYLYNYFNKEKKIKLKQNLYMYFYKIDGRYFIKITDKDKESDFRNMRSLCVIMKYKPEKHKHMRSEYCYNFDKYNFCVVYTIGDKEDVKYIKLSNNREKEIEIRSIIEELKNTIEKA